mgnify:CR=1 FL=1
MLRIIVILILLCAYQPNHPWAYAAETQLLHKQIDKGRVTGLSLPRFTNIKSREVNMRKGPGQRYPIVAVLHCKGYPIQVIEEFAHWRMVRDAYDNVGWVHENLISNLGNAVVKECSGNKCPDGTAHHPENKDEILLLRIPNENAQPSARAKFGTLLFVTQCREKWCKVKGRHNISGWIMKENLWGVN